MRRLVAAVAAACLFSGCAHVHRIDPAASESELDDMNRALQDRQVSVELIRTVPHRPGVGLRAEGVRVAADSTSLTLLLEPLDVSALWGIPGYSARRDTTLMTSVISSMTIKNRSRGALDGSLVGLGIGVTFGAALGAVINDPWLGGRAENAAVGGVVLGTIGSVVGLATGAMRGSRETYDFADRVVAKPKCPLNCRA